MWKSAGRAPSLQVIPWHLPYNWGEKTRKNLGQVKKIFSQTTVYILPKHQNQNQYLIGDFERVKSICLLCGTRITVPPSGIEPQFSTLFDYFTEQ
jgi:hypothetical protein